MIKDTAARDSTITCVKYRPGASQSRDTALLLTALLPPETPVVTPDGLSFIPVEDVGLVAQAHGGALKSGGKPGLPSNEANRCFHRCLAGAPRYSAVVVKPSRNVAEGWRSARR